MKKNLTLLFLLFASMLVYSPNSAVSATNLVKVTWTGTADPNTPPAGVTVSDLTISPVTISGTPTEVGVFTYIITTIGDDDTCEPHTITGTITVTIPMMGCNMNPPGWGESLGTVTFDSRGHNVEISGNGITQIWSGVVTATNCQKEGFAGGVAGNFNADCRSNPGFPGDFFSWCAVVRFADVLCPSPWRVPTRQDFIDLDIAMGGDGQNRFSSSSAIATSQFVQDNYISLWGGAFGGWGNNIGGLHNQGLDANYWTLMEEGATTGHSLVFGVLGTLGPQNWQLKFQGHSLRCVR